MTTATFRVPKGKQEPASERANALAERLEKGAQALIEFAETLTPEEWQTRLPHDGRKVGVVVHHVASAYPVEIQFGETIASGKVMRGVTTEVIDQMNGEHAKAYDGATKEETLDMLRRNSAAAASVLRSFSDAELDRAAVSSLYSDAPITTQFILEDHAVRHSYHHLARIRKAVKR
jgi:hypothetical protein